MKFLYAIGSDPEGPMKIGISGDPYKRLRQLQTGHARRLHLYHSEEVLDESARPLEQIVHHTIGYSRQSGEWFAVDAETARSEIEFARIRFEERVAELRALYPKAKFSDLVRGIL